jgi:hypothetical protein
MPVPVAGIYVLVRQNMDGRDKPGHVERICGSYKKRYKGESGFSLSHFSIGVS